MTSSNGRHKSFQVIYSKLVLRRFRELIDAAGVRERQQISNALRQLDYALRTRADEFGEPRYRHPHLGLEVRHGAIRPLAVQYGLHAERRIVFVQTLQLLSIPS